ncbi:glycosyltransferase family 2 protein [Cryobacterium lyxosi]|uniref:Glycosyltransferase family 2 protein n=2 Tax=Cryobacterium lyxosi TaxID=1259228 RepID=A0A4R8ZLM0_9MICO|nr:glycosyltransferase family 2 protein [Cryobacterium lyxosi]
MTLMVRDEADIIGPMIDHHLSQGVDTIIVTDNGSVDGTLEILQSYEDAIVLKQDLVQRKQQHSVVTAMAREAFTRFGADWVINADADEFWLPTAAGRTLREVFTEIPPDLQTFTVPVIDMIGAASLRGTGLQRLRYRDTRSVTRLAELGLHAHSTPNAVHIGHEFIEVAQGNHSVNLESVGTLPGHLGIEVLHFPWRSWEQFERKVRNSGKAYESNPDLQPSPNHHGMREYRRWKLGSLQSFYVLRHPAEDELAQGSLTGELRLDSRIADAMASPVEDEPLDPFAEQAARTYGPILSATEHESRALAAASDVRIRELLGYIDDAKHRIDGLLSDLLGIEAAAGLREGSLRADLEATRARKIVRLTDAVRRATQGRF